MGVLFQNVLKHHLLFCEQWGAGRADDEQVQGQGEAGGVYPRVKRKVNKEMEEKNKAPI